MLIWEVFRPWILGFLRISGNSHTSSEGILEYLRIFTSGESGDVREFSGMSGIHLDMPSSATQPMWSDLSPQESSPPWCLRRQGGQPVGRSRPSTLGPLPSHLALQHHFKSHNQLISSLFRQQPRPYVLNYSYRFHRFRDDVGLLVSTAKTLRSKLFL